MQCSAPGEGGDGGASLDLTQSGDAYRVLWEAVVHSVHESASSYGDLLALYRQERVLLWCFCIPRRLIAHL